tara:strand:+ start:357 stop:929 length:573 start_codon:yes stop_codon:yes gene_type:complete
MSSVLYYSKYCENCKKLLYELGKTNTQKNVHFLSIDKRINRGKKTYIVLDNGNEIFLPPNITSVPTLLLLNKGNKLLVGNDVMNYFKPQIYQEKVIATKNNMEPLAFSMLEMGTCMSDTYSYLDQTPEEMNAKGEGGLRQMHSFVKLNHNDSIETPPDDYEPDKVGEVDMGKLQAERAAEIAQPTPTHTI